MSFLNLSKAAVLSIATLAAGYTVAEPNDHRSDSVPARPNHKTAMHQEMDHGMMCDEGKMDSCCDKKHKKMCDDMMKVHSESKPCHDGMSDSEAS